MLQFAPGGGAVYDPGGLSVAALASPIMQPARSAHMSNLDRVFAIKFASVYPLYVAKVAKKGRTQAEVDTVITWLTGYDAAGLAAQISKGVDFRTFFAEAPAFQPNAGLITGVVCGVRVETVADPLMQKIRYLDKLVDELAKGKALAKILRSA